MASVIGLINIHEIHKMSEIVVDKLRLKIANVNAIAPLTPELNADLAKYTEQLENSLMYFRYSQLASYYDLEDKTLLILEQIAIIEANIIIDHFNTLTRLTPEQIRELDIIIDKHKYDSVIVIKRKLKSINNANAIISIQEGVQFMERNILQLTGAGLVTPTLDQTLEELFNGYTFVPRVGDLLPNSFLLTDLSRYNPKLNALICNLFSERMTNLNTLTKNVIYVNSKSVAVLLGRILKSIGYGEISKCSNRTPNDLSQTNLSYFAYLRGEVSASDKDEEQEIRFKNVEEGQSDDKPAMIKLFNNDNTGKFNILIINNSVAEGITLKNVNKVHLFSKPPDLSKSQQLVARAYRNCTHPDGGEVTPYLYLNKLDNYDITFDQLESAAIHTVFPEWQDHCRIPILDLSNPQLDTPKKVQSSIDMKNRSVKNEITEKEINDLTIDIRDNDKLLPYLRVIRNIAIEAPIPFP